MLPATANQLRARYGITRQVQLGLTYLIGGYYAEKDFLASMMGGSKFHAGKAVSIPTVRYKVLARLARIAPRRLVERAARRGRGVPARSDSAADRQQ